MAVRDIAASLDNESCLFEVLSEFAADFAAPQKGRLVFRVLSVHEIAETSCVVHVAYLTGERNILHETLLTPQIANVSPVNPNAIAAREFALSVASTMIVPLAQVPAAATILVTVRTNVPFFVRRDTMRVEGGTKEDIRPAHSLLLTIAPGSNPRYLAHASPGRVVFTSRSALGAKGLIFTIQALDVLGQHTRRDIGLVAKLASLGSSAVAIPRARRLERPERFNKEIVLPDETAYLLGKIITIEAGAECFYDIAAWKMTRFRHAVGIPTGIALFEHVSLKIHEDALSRSRQDFLALMQGD